MGFNLKFLKDVADTAQSGDLSHGEKRAWLSKRHGAEHVDDAADHMRSRFEKGLERGIEKRERALESKASYNWKSRVAAMFGWNHGERRDVEKAGEQIGRKYGGVEGLEQALAEKAERKAQFWEKAKDIASKPFGWFGKKNDKGMSKFFSKNWKWMAGGAAAVGVAGLLLNGQEKERYDTTYNDTMNQLNAQQGGMNYASPQVMAGAANAQQMGTLQQMQMQRG